MQARTSTDPLIDEPVVPDPGLEPGSTPRESDGIKDPHIRCPICGWTPREYDRWMCTCRHMWNTFDTGGVCPACMLQWKYTMCPACQIWSAHSDWYQED